MTDAIIDVVGLIMKGLSRLAEVAARKTWHMCKACMESAPF
jgi:hypothetical protein